MKLHVYILVLIFIANLSMAQAQCNQDSLITINGKWKKKNGFHTDAAKSKQPIVRMDKMLKMLQDAYQPKGMEAIWLNNSGRGDCPIKNGPYPYTFTAGFMEYFCFVYQNQNDLKLAIETLDWFFINANFFGSFARLERDFLIENKEVYLRTPKMGELNGFSVFAGLDGNGLRGKKLFSRSILITRPGELPYTPVTRKQYLLAFLAYMEESYKAKIAYELKTPRRTDAEEQILYQKGYDKIAQIKTTDERYEKGKQRELERYVRNYVTDKQAQQNTLNRMETNYKMDIDPANKYLANHSAEELAQPAILKSTNYLIGDYKEFVSENEGYMMVQVNEKYFNNKLPPYIPQFFVVDWTYGNHPVELNLGTKIEKNFDFNALQQMIDK